MGHVRSMYVSFMSAALHAQASEDALAKAGRKTAVKAQAAKRPPTVVKAEIPEPANSYKAVSKTPAKPETGVGNQEPCSPKPKPKPSGKPGPAPPSKASQAPPKVVQPAPTTMQQELEQLKEALLSVSVSCGVWAIKFLCMSRIC